jgi:P-type Ca2+ transporter type 2C
MQSNTKPDQRTGLTDSEVSDKRKQYGRNALPEEKRRTTFEIYLGQFKNPLIYIICVAGAIALLMGEVNDAIIIGAVIMLNSVIGFFQEYKAEEGVSALKSLVKEKAIVIRNGSREEINASDLVPGDLVVINDGDKIPADGNVIESVFFTANEAILTGESEPIPKKVKDPVFMGTTVFSGRSLFEVTNIGVNTELGKIAGSLATMKEEQTPLQIRLEKFGSFLTKLVVAITLAIFVIGVLSGFPLLEMVNISIVLAIAAIPEGLLIAVTMILVLGMRGILRCQGLVKKLLAVETLGSVTTICTDKTGTLTEGVMQVVQDDFKDKEQAAHILVLCNNQTDSLEAALMNHVKVLGFNPEEIASEHIRLYEIPFTSEKKYMLTVNEMHGVQSVLIKGAPEVVMDFCTLTREERSRVEAKVAEWAVEGLKPLAVIYREGNNAENLTGFNWIGLVGIQDPVRPSVKNAIALCHQAGINVKVITGDYRGTAEKVANTIGLSTASHQVVSGSELELMTEQRLTDRIRELTVFYRVVPSQKLKIVKALQAKGEVVAMIGDGVNDAPALKKANIGVSVGGATDVAKETASLILLDNNFGTLVSTIEEGRIIFENIKKVVAYVLSNSFAEIALIFGAMLLGLPAPLSVAQILWIHLICDGPSDIVLGFERETGLMDNPPKRLDEDIIDKRGKFLIPAISFTSSMLCLWFFRNTVMDHGDVVMAQSVIFTALGTMALIYIFSFRSFHKSVFMPGTFWSNKWLFLAVAFGFAQQLVALYVPFFSNMLGVKPLGLVEWGEVMAIGFGMLIIVEIVKYVARETIDHKPHIRASR